MEVTSDCEPLYVIDNQSFESSADAEYWVVTAGKRFVNVSISASEIGRGEKLRISTWPPIESPDIV